jgi:hypothetical protein
VKLYATDGCWRAVTPDAAWASNQYRREMLIFKEISVKNVSFSLLEEGANGGMHVIPLVANIPLAVRLTMRKRMIDQINEELQVHYQ